MIDALWYEIPHDFENIKLHSFAIMPNHIHGIIEMSTVGVPLVGTLKNGLQQKGNHKGLPLRGDNILIGDVIGAFKSKTTNTYIKMVKNGTLPPFNKRIWQRNYYEHVVRDDADYVRLATYIENNPQKWEEDMFSP